MPMPWWVLVRLIAIGAYRIPLSVHGCNDIPSTVLLSCYQARHHSLYLDSADGVSSGVVRARSPGSNDASVRP